jgi:hypothetical protein
MGTNGASFCGSAYIYLDLVHSHSFNSELQESTCILLGLDYRANSRILASNYWYDSCAYSIKSLSCAPTLIIHHVIVRIVNVHDLACI